MKVVEASNFARELGDLPGNIGTPAAIVERVRAEIRDRNLPIELSTISAAQAAKLGMGLFTAVDAGAPERGCILRLDYFKSHLASRGDDETEAPLVAFVGKGLTHDTGGYNIKLGPSTHELTYDKCGATAVIGAMLAIASLELPLRLVGLCPLTENCIDARAFKPGDVLTACDGTTVYIENTDAEGRLVLADVLAWLGKREPRPDLVIDLATLTGVIHAALGEPFAGLYCNEDRARELLVAAGQCSGELLWPMPIHDVHERDLGHHKADLRNIGALAGAPSSAAAFLRSFVDYPWAHIDLAGKSHCKFAREHYGPGATGFGTRLLVELARQLSREAA
jgi:leucyl aminopeptidase